MSSSLTFFDGHQMLRVPVEQLVQACRKQHKLVEKELGEIHEALKASKPCVNALVDRLQGLKRKVEDNQVHEDELLQRCRMRLEYLRTAQADVGSERLRRLVADWLLRAGYDESARRLAEQAGVERYLDFELVLSSRSVLTALKAREPPGSFLLQQELRSWCAHRRETASRPWFGVRSIAPS